MLESPQQTVAVVGLKRQPLLLCRIRRRQPNGQIDVAIVAGQGRKARQPGTQTVGGRQVQRMIALQYVVSAAIGGYAAEPRGNENIRVGIPISMSIGGKVVGN